MIVNSGKREPLYYVSSKVKVEGQKGIIHNGIIDLTGKQQIKQEIKQERKKVTKQNNLNNLNVVKLKSGQKINFNDLKFKSNDIILCFEWEYKNIQVDMDISLFLVNESKVTEESNFVFYGNKISKDKSVNLELDMNKGLKNSFNQVVGVNLSRVDKQIVKIAIAATFYNENQKFGDIINGKIHFVDPVDMRDVVVFNFSDNLENENAIVIGEIYKYNGKWKFASIGKGFIGGLEALCENFGIETE